MDLVDTQMILGLAGIFLIAGITKGIVGIALPAVSVGLMTFFLEPRLAVALLIPSVLFTNARQSIGARPVWEIAQTYMPFILTACAVVLAVALFGARVSLAGLFIAVGLAQVIFAISGLLGRLPVVKPERDSFAQIGAGFACGVLGGLSAIWGPPIVAYLSAKRLEKDDMIQVLGVLLTLQAIALTLGFALSGGLSIPVLGVGALMIIPSLVGMRLGRSIQKRFDTAQFMQVLLIVFLCLGFNLIRRGIWG